MGRGDRETYSIDVNKFAAEEEGDYFVDQILNSLIFPSSMIIFEERLFFQTRLFNSSLKIVLFRCFFCFDGEKERGGDIYIGCLIEDRISTIRLLNDEKDESRVGVTASNDPRFVITLLGTHGEDRERGSRLMLIPRRRSIERYLLT